MADALIHTPAGLFCPEGGFHIDPERRVDRAVITHAHSDHARPGMGAYLCTALTAVALYERLGPVPVDVMAYGETRQIGGARVSLHPAGHVPGSAQVRVEVAGRVWVVTGDYKTEDDGMSEPWEPVACHVFVSECTFGLPIFRWPDQAMTARAINHWWAANAAAGRLSVIGAYSLGKAQRLLSVLEGGIGPILTHSAVTGMNAALRKGGLALRDTLPLTPATDLSRHPGALVVAPSQGQLPGWQGEVAFASVSGWNAVARLRQQRGGGTGFVMSDHADWPGLAAAIRATGASEVHVMHGFTGPFRRWLAEQGYDARIVGGAAP